MKRFRTALSILLALVSLASSGYIDAKSDTEMLKNLSQLKWKKRVLLVSNPKNKDSTELALTSAVEDINDRDLVWFILSEEKLYSNRENVNTTGLKAQIRAMAKKSKSVVLIGKDGGVKYQSSSLDLTEIFKTIDAMPMRRQEMKERR